MLLTDILTHMDLDDHKKYSNCTPSLNLKNNIIKTVLKTHMVDFRFVSLHPNMYMNDKNNFYHYFKMQSFVLFDTK